MAKTDPYREFLKKDFNGLFETLELKERQKHYLRSRWLDQVLWMESRAAFARDRYYFLRLITIVGGVILPILVSLDAGDDARLRQYLKYSTIGLSGVVAVTAALEEFFHYGERWRHYRRSVESLKSHGWEFFQLTGPYSTYKVHTDAFSVFAGQVEEVIQRDVEVYATTLTKEKEKSGSKQEESSEDYPYQDSRDRHDSRRDYAPPTIAQATPVVPPPPTPEVSASSVVAEAPAPSQAVPENLGQGGVESSAPETSQD